MDCGSNLSILNGSPVGRPCTAAAPAGERFAGAALVMAVLLITGGTSVAVLFSCYKISFWLYLAVTCIMCWQALAARCLQSKAMKVQRILEQDDLPAARKQIAMLVGRDTQQLDRTQVVKAAVETVMCTAPMSTVF